MKNIYKANYLLKALLLIGFFGGVLTSCKKDAAVLLQDAAYVRFFNGITYYRYNSADNDDAAARYLPPNVTSINTVANFYNDGPISGNNPAPIQYRQPAPLVSFFVDPQLDDQGLPVSADVTADFIGTQKTYYTPQPDAVGDPVSTIQGDFPGVQGVERAPVVGGVDLSRWARIKSGKHRFLIIYRTLYNTDNLVYTNTGQLDPTARVTYYNLTQAQKAASIKGTYLKTTVAMDTTVNLDAHAVYTVKIVNKNKFNLVQFGTGLGSATGSTAPSNYNLLVRKENFEQQNLSSGKLYVRFFNNTNDAQILPDQFDVYHRVAWFTKNDVVYNPLTGAWVAKTNYTPKRFSQFEKVATVSGRFLNDAALAPYAAITAIPTDSLLYPDGTFMGPTRLVSSEIPAPISGYSRHELYFYPVGQGPVLTGNPNNDVPGTNVLPAGNANLLGLQLQMPIFNGNNKYYSKPVLNTIDLNTNYLTWNTFQSILGKSGSNIKISLIQEQIQ
ncbi:hypothetical protein [Mucilaginibacter paludis]|uniref:Lipoprotein n=1 Tax=Mucilaginibacter paludis DSM 18603 TaxID=714943 RepID=H1Y9B4_9SPHI|nr:hypothetical protein [Mucilaginibacter paludis]EHQ29492.1 hypothetical protein Mucpa_5420 [Mucilaginibacter paludis DSM 18603]